MGPFPGSRRQAIYQCYTAAFAHPAGPRPARAARAGHRPRAAVAAEQEESALRVAFQGEWGAFGEEAVIRLYGDEAEPVPYPQFPDVFRAVASGQVDRGVVPVENSIAGTVNEVYDLLRQFDLFVQGEQVVPVELCLMALPGQTLADIRRVYSHPKALEQCERFLRELGVEAIALYDTAGSARLIREQGWRGVAAVASRRAAERYGLEILAAGIQDVSDNYTRFVALGREPAPRQPGPTKTMLVMATQHVPGSLYRCLGCLARRGINLLKLESRPTRDRPWEYLFYLDFEGHRDEPHVAEALAELSLHTNWLKVLGSFPRRDGVPH